MAEVYRARDELLGRHVAVKVLNERLSSDRQFVERFRREAQAAANLNHPNVVSLYDYGSDEGTNFIVMEFIDGESLSDIIQSEGPLMPERAAEIARDVAFALERAHAAGLVHRDIKPANIMVTRSGQTKVTDFGIARALDADQTMTQTGMVMGTAAYLSPEQAQGNPVDSRSDIYSLGCVLYETLTGTSPFTGDTPLSIAYKHVREHARPPSAQNADVPASLDAVTMKALAKNPENRYSSAAEMAEDLDRFTKGERVHATPLLGGETRVATAVGSGTRVLPREELEPDEEETKSRAGWYALLALAILAIFGLLAWWLATNVLGGDIRVPNVVGLEVNEARDRLEEANLDPTVKKRFSNKPVDEVVEQDPEAGEMVDEGATVTLFVSRGPRTVEVPGVVGSTLQEARNELRRSDLRVGGVSREPSDQPEGTVLRQDPAEGEEVNQGTRVALVVSAGPEPVLVPFVVGQTEDSAIAEIEGAQLDPEVRRETDDAPEGEVIAQDPEGGTEVEPGDTVVITVSRGPEKRKMPDVRGDDADNAEDQLEDEYGLDVSQEPAEESCAQAPGTVCDQDPKPGQNVRAGDEATLFVEPEVGAAVGSPTIAIARYPYLF
jgi:beta-lactam-binding protein with PASTA domain/tRNA A-37 threonylcarbamoyl transferase component Bud32